MQPAVRYHGMSVMARINPGDTYVRKFDLPSCFVHSDPCTQNVMLRYAVYQGRQSFWIETRLPQYVFVPDPTATYAIDGLRGNRAVFITRAIARELATPENLDVDVAASRSEPQPPFKTAPPLVADITTALKAEGVVPSGTGLSTSASTWSVQLHFIDARSTFDEIIRALQHIRTTFEGRIAGISQRFTINQASDGLTLANRASDSALETAQRLALMTHAGDLQATIGNNGSGLGAFPQFYAGYDARPDSVPDFTHGAPLYNSTLTVGTSAQVTPVAVAVEAIYPSTSSVQLASDATLTANVAAAFRQPESWSLPAFNPQLDIAADRPEIYVIGTASSKEALRLRIFPEFIAALDARNRSRIVAD
ncbi:MAG TPA: hypothetical protein VFE17_10420, partial [Candidatus Baltobacteraceae bacterium]|nr:hypothetical protein [Candidatus Baltobacteraceae bacterium]